LIIDQWQILSYKVRELQQIINIQKTANKCDQWAQLTCLFWLHSCTQTG